ncbi:hypothetical protein F4778DRAFT_784617 [Xylariomycetidae sp. FL2044]|nr:hypothetical protein F4778DRAFT_784617 [Xylariomycetidae sp. FL2044]
MQLGSLANKVGTKVGGGVVGKYIGVYEQALRWFARALQFIFAIVVIGLYGHRVDNDRKAGNPQSAAWVYAVLVAGLSCITCLIYSIPLGLIKVQRLFAWDLILFVLWLAVFGTFAALFLHREGDEYQGTSVSTMRHAVWVDLVNAIFWILTGVWGFVRTFIVKTVRGRLDGAVNAVENKMQTAIEDKIHAKVNAKVAELRPAYMV